MRIRSNKGFTLIELLIVVAIIGIIAAIAIPGLLRARMAGNEASAIGSMRAFNSSQAAFSSTCAFGLYAPDPVHLGNNGIVGVAPFISPDLVQAVLPITKSGYLVTMAQGSDAVAGGATTPQSCNGYAATALVSSWYANAVPMTPGASGTRYFFINTLGTVYQDTAAPIATTTGAIPPTTTATLNPIQ